MDRLFITIEEITKEHRPLFEPMLKACVAEVGNEHLAPGYLHSIGKNSGLMAFDVAGNQVAYLLYNQTENQPMTLLNFWCRPDRRERHVMSRLITTAVAEVRPKSVMVIIDETLFAAHLMLGSLGFICTQTLKSDESPNQQNVFRANRWSYFNRISRYAVNTL